MENHGRNRERGGERRDDRRPARDDTRHSRDSMVGTNKSRSPISRQQWEHPSQAKNRHGCERKKYRKLREHVLTHLPQCFNDSSSDPMVAFHLHAAIVWLGKHLLPSGEGLQALVDMLNGSGLLKTYPVSPLLEKRLRALVERMGIEHPKVFTTCPINSISLLGHWGIAGELVNLLSNDQKREFLGLFGAPNQEPIPATAGLTQTVKPDRKDLSVTLQGGKREVRERGENSGEVTNVEENGGEGIDSHCHLDRLQQSLGLEPSSSRPLMDILRREPSLGGRDEATIERVITVYCDPDTYPVKVYSLPRISTVVGLHPKQYHVFNEAKNHLAKLITDPLVIGFGEIALDHTIPRRQWYDQQQVFVELLRMAPKNKPLVIHCRGLRDFRAPETTTVHCLCMDLMAKEFKASCKSQTVHVHSFNGEVEVMREWQRKFPLAYFAFTGAVQHFAHRQREALRAVPSDRLLIETDSPHLTPHTAVSPAGVNSPSLLKEVARLVAPIRGVTVANVLRVTARNARTCYGLSRREGQ